MGFLGGIQWSAMSQIAGMNPDFSLISVKSVHLWQSCGVIFSGIFIQLFEDEQ